MEIHGREVTFKRTVWADCELNRLSNGSVEQLEKSLEADYVTSQLTSAKIIAVLSKGAEMARKYEEPGYEPKPLTEDEALSLTGREFSQAFREALKAWADEKPTIEAVPKKTVKKTAQK